ncbi:MAG: sulfotransferase [Marinobacter adhaerens]|uniref:Sulfotransferase n=1 Tax=Marinobacter adhaerens TaxID=1033846 RepID=A0A844I537_9GAMM|nr:sulfotransferase [Marinobacter adhaerens]
MSLNASDHAFAAAGKHCLFLMGVPRSGTTWLRQTLTAPPDVGASQESHPPA